jgi:hypothetical protein
MVSASNHQPQQRRQFCAVAGDPPSVTRQSPALSKPAAQSNPHNGELLATPAGSFFGGFRTPASGRLNSFN